MVKLLRCVALAVVVAQAQSALQCLGGSFTLQGTFDPEFATAVGYGTAMKSAVVAMSGSSAISADHVTASIVIGTAAPAAGDCAAAIALTPAPTNAPAASATTMAPANATTMAPATTTAEEMKGPSETFAPWPSTTMVSSGPSMGPAEARLLEDQLDHEARQLGGHSDNGASVSYTVVADAAVMEAIETSIGDSTPDAVLAAVNSAIATAVLADSNLVAPSISSASAPTQVEMVLDTRTPAPLASTDSEESFASKSFCSLVGLTLAATSILV